MWLQFLRGMDEPDNQSRPVTTAAGLLASQRSATPSGHIPRAQTYLLYVT